MKARRVLKWTGIAACVAIFSTWVASRWLGAFWSWTAPQWQVSVGTYAGCLWVGQQSGNWVLDPAIMHSYDGVHIMPTARWLWGPTFSRKTGSGASGIALRVPLYFPLLLLIVPTAILVYRDRRAAVGGCARCGYDRTGLPPRSPCPECGKGDSA